MNPLSAEHLNSRGHSTAILDVLLVLSVNLLALDLLYLHHHYLKLGIVLQQFHGQKNSL